MPDRPVAPADVFERESRSARGAQIESLPATDDSLTQDLLGPDAADLAAASLATAHRFASGATLWCAAPSWPWHAQRVAAEFVHPVIAGTRALSRRNGPGQPFVGNLEVDRARRATCCSSSQDLTSHRSPG